MGSIQPDPCLGCDTRQFGKRVPSMIRDKKNGMVLICQSCAQFEDVEILRKHKPLRGHGRNQTPPS